MPGPPFDGDLHREIAALRVQLDLAEESLRAIRGGEVDALFVAGASGERLFTLAGADRAYRQLIEEMGEGAITLTANGVVAYANRCVAELLGRPLGQVIGSRIHAWFAAGAHELLTSLLVDGRNAKRNAELDLFPASGPPVPVLLSVSRLDIDGLADAVCMIVTDLTAQKRGEAAIQARQILQKVIEDQKRAEENLRISLATLRLRDNALGAISQGVLIADSQGRMTYANAACESISGYSAAEMAGRSASMLQGPETSADTLKVLRHAIDAVVPFHGEILNYRKDGTRFRNELSVTPVFDEKGVHTQFVGVMRDVTARWQADLQLALAAKMFEQSSEGFIVTDADCNIVKVNQAFTTISGFTEADALGKNPRLLASGRHDAAFFQAMWEDLKACGQWQGEIWNRRKDGAIYPQWQSISRVVDKTGLATHYVGSFSDITQRKESEERIRLLAHFDPLTGLPNRALLVDHATRALQLAQRGNEPVALMFIDLDHFKNVNDSLGHDVGDRLLVALAGRFKLALRDHDTLSRVGGDEFVLLLPGTDASGAAHVAQKLLQLAAAPYQIGQNELTITPSIGIALYPLDGPDYATLARSADAAMYRAKECGRNGFCFHTSEMQAQSARELLLENALRRALERDQMLLNFQPQLSLANGQIVGAEALLRWHHPDFGWVSPSEFIPIAESSGLISAIGEWVLRSAVRQMRVWLDRGMAPMTMAVNVSSVQFRQQTLPDLVARVLGEAGVGPECLELELTESVASADPVGTIAVMNQLHERGVRMSIDDFGTGYSSLNYLKRFKVYKLKIDQSFVREVTKNQEDQAIVAAIISLARSLGMQTIAEGVETIEQMEYMRDKGCDEMQGYWLSRPLPADQFEAFVQFRAASAPAGGRLAMLAPVSMSR
jgi:diguanylate cyclase (GGDEF)-like protein/PAS domain S-box-containing protein